MPKQGKNSPVQVMAAVDRIIQEYQETEDIKLLSDFHLLQTLGNISSRTLERYYDGTADKALLSKDNISSDNTDEYTKQTYGDAMKKLIEFRRQTCVEHLTGDRFNSGWIFLSKQPHYGGFQDIQRVEKTGNQTFNIHLTGSDGGTLRSE